MRLRMGAPVRGARQRSWKRRLLLRGKEVQDERSDDAIERGASHGGELPVGEKYQTMERQRQRTFRHRLDPQPVSFVRSLEGVDTVAIAAGPDDGVHCAGAQSVHGFFGLSQPAMQLPDLFPEFC